MATAKRDTTGLNQAPPPSYLIVIEEMEGLPSYEDAVMVGRKMKQDMVSKVAKEEHLTHQGLMFL